MRLSVSLVLFFLTGCVATGDVVHLLTVPRTVTSYQGPAIATRQFERRREVALEPQAGLVCNETHRPRVQRIVSTLDTEESTGYRAAAVIGTALDLAALTGVVAARESACGRRPECGSALLFYIWFLPLVADIPWGVYRSLTIHPEIYRFMFLDRSEEPGDDVLVTRVPCAPGTVIALRSPAANARITVRIGPGGRLDPGDRQTLFAFVTAHGDIQGERTDGVDIHFDATRRSELLSQRSSQAVSSGSFRRAHIEFRVDGPPVVTGVPVDFPLDAVCPSDAACARGQRCRDRGDGVTLCMGPGVAHPFCVEDVDCPQGQRCLPRSTDGVGTCSRAE